MGLRWGIIGTGGIARVFAKAVAASARGEALAVASRSKAKAEAFAKDMGVARAYGSYDDLLADAEIDIVYVATPHTVHAENVLAAARARKHILCEKPLGVTAGACEQMNCAAQTNGVSLFEAFMYRVHPQTARIRRLVDDGALGKVRAIHSTFCYGLGDAYNVRLDKGLRGGGLYDVGCYCVNFSRMVAGGEPSAVEAVAVTGAATGVDENLVGALRFPSGALASFHCSVRSMGDAGAFVLGTAGALRIPNPWKPGLRSSIHLARVGKPAEEIVVESPAECYELEADHVAAVLAGEADSLLDGQDAAGNASVLDAIWRSVHGSS
jgi:predicted dehydrogenase